ncbi:DUF3035 domain-containing protein [Pikeienuella sp. HZG-20]|uniref:DUF3035 domain-containing protein n=1 Tax=Paludibacillus litoralis TaxID=3133267 RepID=UPI0030ED5229
MPHSSLAAFLRRAAPLAAAAVLGGCTISSSDGGGSIGEQLGLVPGTPDAFMIIARAPLEIPPDFTLPTPQPGAVSPRDPDPLAEAEQTLFGQQEPAPTATASAGEQALLAGAGANVDNSAARTELESRAAPERRYGLTSVLGYKIPAGPNDRNYTVEALEENERLRQQGLLTPTAPPIEDDDK